MATAQQPASTSMARTTSDDVFVPSLSISAGDWGQSTNLFSIDYSTSHPDATDEECAIAFKALDDKELKRYRALGQKRRHEMKDKSSGIQRGSGAFIESARVWIGGIWRDSAGFGAVFRGIWMDSGGAHTRGGDEQRQGVTSGAVAFRCIFRHSQMF
ncbi:hypothetical protein BOTBODRAFT_175805 [Botryobasidium botryosum FD-172 SS1]|uniref:Uncharacterized protein n=1 Tax=Botryobasidium botryosum (strain FD-172 SS1) TaxID=930990 RepID=A0A067MEQ5_BOTB1|nr:hypothetical protein BOTBODRAFT_175805 [Botryobasidium botryosum FD-172 SS1]